MQYEEMKCCGIWELSGLQSSTKGELESDFKTFINENMYDSGEYQGPAVLIFSTTQQSTNGDDLKKLIEKHQLGDVMRSRPRRNPNTENMLTVFTWGINKKNLRKYWVANCPTEEADTEDDDEFGN